MERIDLGNILVATDFSKQAEAAFGQALAVAARTGAGLTVLWVELASIAPPSGAALYATAVAEVERMVASARAEAEDKLETLVERARAVGVSARSQIAGGDPDEAIVACGEDAGADLIVTGTRGSTGFKRFFLGSVAQNVLRKSNTNVMVVRGEADARLGRLDQGELSPANDKALAIFNRILVPCDFSPASEKALAIALALAPQGAAITLFHAWQYPPGVYGVNSPNPRPGPLAELRDRIIDQNKQHGDALVAKYRGDGYQLSFAQDYGPAASLIHDRLAREPVDLVAMGTHGYRGFQRLILGSVAEATVRHADCSVLVAHAQGTGAPAAD